MITGEPKIKVGIFERCREVRGRFNGAFHIDQIGSITGDFCAEVDQGNVLLRDTHNNQIVRGRKIHCSPAMGATFRLFDVGIGIDFHWERKEEQVFQGDLILLACEEGTMTTINQIYLEDYLVSVISSEMSAEAPIAFLKAHAVISRSWLVSMLERGKEEKHIGISEARRKQRSGELICWYGGKDHQLFDVCADDHCQRYQGITRITSANATEAVGATRGLFLIYEGRICDARYHKACGGLTDNFDETWEDTPVPYLSSVSDSPVAYKFISSETDAQGWILSSPDVYCNTREEGILRCILPSFDQRTTDYFRWAVQYSREELEKIIHDKSGIDFGTLCNLIPLKRGPSGRISRLSIEGSKRTMVIGKELEIRRCLSRSHLYSSAFIVTVERDRSGMTTGFILHGAGWGHGVGLCQIGAAVMALKGFSAEEILGHYFRGATLQKLY